MHLRETEFNPQNKDLVAFPIKNRCTPPLLAEAGPREEEAHRTPARTGRLTSGCDWSGKKVTALLLGFVQMWRWRDGYNLPVSPFLHPTNGDKEGELKKEDSREVGRGFSITFIDMIVDARYEIMRGDQIRESCELGSKSHLSILLYLNRPKIQYMQAWFHMLLHWVFNRKMCLWWHFCK